MLLSRIAPSQHTSKLEGRVIKIINSHEDAVILEGLRQALQAEADIEIVAEARSIVGLFEAVETNQPKVVILDALLPDADALDVIQRLQAMASTPGILILSTFNDPGKIGDLMTAGVLGYCSRCDDIKLIPAAIRAVVAGLPCTSPTVRRRLLEYYVRPRLEQAAMPNFTERERDVLRLLAKGLPRQQTANAMGISDRTLRDYLDAIRSKTGLTTREEMIVYAVEQGFGRDE